MEKREKLQRWLIRNEGEDYETGSNQFVRWFARQYRCKHHSLLYTLYSSLNSQLYNAEPQTTSLKHHQQLNNNTTNIRNLLIFSPSDFGWVQGIYVSYETFVCIQCVRDIFKSF